MRAPFDERSARSMLKDVHRLDECGAGFAAT